MSCITVFVKLLSGDMLALDVRPDITRKQFYARVYLELPEEVAPSEDYMMTLLRSSEQKEEQEQEQELLADEDPLRPCPDEIFFAIMDPSEYALSMSMGGFDAYEMTRPMNYIFQAREIIITCWNESVKKTLQRESFYYNNDDHTWFLQDGILTEWVGRHEDELAIRIPDDAVAYGSIERLVTRIIQRLPNSTKRIQAHLASSFLQQWSETIEGRWNEEEEEQDFVGFDDDGAWPVRA